jgi:hypothetical protein
MYGARHPYAVISRLGRRLEANLAPEAVLPAVVETIAQALKLPYAAILLREGEGFRTAAAYGSLRGEPEALPLVYQREEIGRLALSLRAPGEGFSDADLGLLEDLARQAEVAVHAVRPTTDLQHSRECLVATREEERRRPRRDLHDGLGAQLAGLNVQAGPGRGSASSLSESHRPRARDPKPHRTRTPQPFDRQPTVIEHKDRWQLRLQHLHQAAGRRPGPGDHAGFGCLTVQDQCSFACERYHASYSAKPVTCCL